MDITAEQINMAFNNLLEAKSKAITKLGIKNIIHQVVSNYKLIEQKSLALENNIVFVLIDLLDIRDFEGFLRKDVGISIDQSRQILNEIEEKIFKPVRDLTDYYLEEKEEGLIGEEKKISGVSSLKAIHGKELNNKAAFGVESIFQSRVIDIGKKYKLPIDQLGALVSVTNLVISGEIYASQYRGKLKEKINIDAETFEKIVGDVNEEVFKKIRQKMIEEKIDEGFIDDKDIPIPPYASLPIINRSVFNKNNIPEKKEEFETQIAQPKELEKTDNVVEKETINTKINAGVESENKDIVQEILGSMEHKENRETPVVIKPVFSAPPEATIPSVLTEPVVTDKTAPVVDKPEIILTTTKNTIPVISPVEIPESTPETSTIEVITEKKIIPQFIKPITNDSTPVYDTISSPDISQKNEGTPVLEPEKTIDNDKTEIPIPNINTPKVEIQNEIIPSPVSQVAINDALKNVDLENIKQDVVTKNNILVNSGIEIPIANQEMPDVEIIDEENNTSSTVQNTDIPSLNIKVSSNGQNPINNNVFSSSGIEIPISNPTVSSVETENKTPTVIQPSTKEDPIFSQNNSIYADSGVEIIPDNKKSSTDDPYREVF